MKYFKITKTWAVKAESEAEAVKLVAANPADYLVAGAKFTTAGIFRT
jgi:hypothetical protein